MNRKIQDDALYNDRWEEEEKKSESEKKAGIGDIFFWFGMFVIGVSTFILATIYGTRTDMRFLFFVCIFILIVGKQCLGK